MNDSIKRIFLLYKKHWYAPFLILFGIVLLLNPKETKPSEAVYLSSINDNTYVEEMESRVETMLKDMSGMSGCRVTITLASGRKKEYVREEGRVLVITDKDGNQSAVISKENAPEIAGVTVICSGSLNINIKNEIVQSVSTVLGIGANKICVVLLNGE